MLVYGDTNSTMAAALAAVKLHIPVYHVEAGNLFETLDSPEEVNRKVTDHVSTVVMPCTESHAKFLENKGLKEKPHIIGDPMYDAFLYYGSLTRKDKNAIVGFDGEAISRPNYFYYLTYHRQ